MTKPRKSRSSAPAASPLGPPVEFDPAAVDALLGGRQTMAELDDLFRQMKKVLMERALSGELTYHLGYGRGEPKPTDQANYRNGTTPKTVLTEDGAIPLAIPRDCAGTFEPVLVPKNARRHIKKRWSPAPDWVAAITHFAVLFSDRFTPDPR